MSKIRVKNFGPIKDGYANNDGWIEIKKVTVFIGNQGSGKSTVAKLISTMTWIEKALVRGDFKERDIIQYNRLKKQFVYQNIFNYFKDNTEIDYQGNAYHITYVQGNIKVNKNENNGYLFPKIMYVPAERNFVSAVDKPTSLKKLPNTLYTFLDELENAKEEIKEALTLPVNEVRFEYQKSGKISYISGLDYKIRLSEASSGFQSLVPLFLVTRYLANSINQDEVSEKKNLSVEEGNRIRREIEKILSNPNLSEDIKKASLEFLSSKFKYSCFINIVEEPEQNLFPSSQRRMLNSLMEYNNLIDKNNLIITTHSPYIINFLSIAVQGKYLKDRIEAAGRTEDLLPRLNEIIPEKSLISSHDVVVYQLSEIDGSINELPSPEGIPSDKNYLNDMLKEGNQLFDSLLEIEEEL